MEASSLTFFSTQVQRAQAYKALKDANVNLVIIPMIQVKFDMQMMQGLGQQACCLVYIKRSFNAAGFERPQTCQHQYD